MIEKDFKREDLRAYLYSDAILHNVKRLRNCCRDNVKFCAVVKANAYGHGISEVVNILKNTQVDFFGVSNVYEAFYIAGQVTGQQIIVLEPLHPGLPAEVITQCAQLDFHCTISSKRAAEYISSVLNEQQAKLKVHINIDTGMGRCGVSVSDTKQLVELVCKSKSMEFAGIYTHFANADEKDLSFTKEQLNSFKKVLKSLDSYINENVIIHAANSPATMKLPDAHFDMVRCGISIYGYSTIEKPLPVELKPALKLKAPIVHINTIEKGQTISYGRTFVAKRTTKIGVLPIGYSDGFWRFFSNKVKLIVNDKIASVLGRVTMNQIVLDITDIPDVQLGQSVTIIDDNYDSPCGVYSLAKLSGTICYEILTNIPLWCNTEIVE